MLKETNIKKMNSMSKNRGNISTLFLIDKDFRIHYYTNTNLFYRLNINIASNFTSSVMSNRN
jgi:hypothetical protein